MALITKDTKLSEIIIHDPSTITVLDRFGINLGVGDAQVIDACNEKGIDIDFFITILNTFINENYFPKDVLDPFSALKIVEYLNKTNEYYEKNVIPNIERHFTFLLGRTQSPNSNLVLMRKFFDEVKSELLQRIEDDRNNWFPQICQNEKLSGNYNEATCECQENCTDNIEDKIDDLINMLIVHLKGDYDHNLGYAVIVAIFSLKKDIKQNNRIRNRILRPISQALKQ